MRTEISAAARGAVIYCRVSTQEQADNFSLQTQEKACRELCARENLSVLSLFVEAESAKTLERAEFQSMMDYCVQHRKEVSAVIVYSISRFSRQTSDHLSAKLILQKLGIVLRSVTEPFDNTPSGRFTETVMSAYAQLDNEIKAERTRDGMMAAINEGKWVHRAPLGYIHNAAVPGGLIHDANQASFVRTCFELFDSGRSKAEVLSAITSLGLRTSTGLPVSAQSLDNLLMNPLYAGVICIPKWGLVVDGKFAPIIDRTLFERVQDRLNGKQAGVSKPDRSEHFPLRVFLRCAACGNGLTGSFATGKLGGKYPYYFCRTKGCRAVSFRAFDLQYKFLDLLSSMRLRPGFRGLVFEAIRLEWQKRKSVSDELLAQTRKQVSKLLGWKEKIVKAWIEEKISKEIYEAQMQKVSTDLQVAGLTEGATFADLAEIELLLDFADRMLSEISVIWATATWQDKQRIQRAVFPNGLPVTKEGVGTPEETFLFRQLSHGTWDESSLASPGGFEPPLPP